MILTQHPTPGSFNIYRCGDIFQLKLTIQEDTLQPYLRTSLGGAQKQRNAFILNTENDQVTSRNNWIDFPLEKINTKEYQITLPLTEVGIFEAKLWFKDNDEACIWAPGDNIQIKIEPASTIANNSIYGVFTRQFGPNKHKEFALNDEAETIEYLDKKGYHVIPPSGTFRDVISELDHIMDTMGFRLIQLLPIHPTPTTYARMGRFGSPYAALDFFSVDPSLAEFDKQATPLDQFIELVDAIHRKKGEIYIDIPVDHTGWASVLQEKHPEYFVKDEHGNFASPGAWGTVWADLVKLDFNNTQVHQMMADVFLFWCEKGVDGFRCDAGYMIPFDAWQYIIAKVRTQYPDAIFLLEGLGGPPEVTKQLLTNGTFSWAYSELFQNYSKESIEHYLGEMLHINSKHGGMMNFSETHDNSRLADTSKTWSHMRNLLCALTAPAGGFGISNGVEFYAKEKISVHHASGLNWDNEENLKAIFRRIATIYITHPAFYADADITLTHQDSPHIFSCKRKAKYGNEVHIIVNLNCEEEQYIDITALTGNNNNYVDLLTEQTYHAHTKLEAGQALCLENSTIPLEKIEAFDIKANNIIDLQRTKAMMLSIHQHLNNYGPIKDNYISEHIENIISKPLDFCLKEGAKLSQITLWDAYTDDKRHVMVCDNSILLISCPDYFDYAISNKQTTRSKGVAIRQSNGHYFALVPIIDESEEEILYLDLKVNLHHTSKTIKKHGKLALLPTNDSLSTRQAYNTKEVKEKELYALCTNNAGSMAQMSGLWGGFNSKYDSFFAANLHPEVPVDRTALLSRIRCWVVYNEFSHELGEKSQYCFRADGAHRATWSFKAPTGQGKFALINIHYYLYQDRDQAFLSFERINDEEHDDLLDASTPVKLIIRPDLEYRSNHEVSKAFTGPEATFAASVEASNKAFSFKPYDTTALHLRASHGAFVQETEWQYMHFLPVEADRGLEAHTDLFSPGYFYFNIEEGERKDISISTAKNASNIDAEAYQSIPDYEEDSKVLKRSMQKYIVRRNEGQTVIAGYPWFLDWGRDTLICLRGIIAAGMQQESKDIFRTFAKYEENGSLPNMIRGNNASNRDTSDAPLWFIVALHDYTKHYNDVSILTMDCEGRSIMDVIISIAENYIKGTPNGIRMDHESGLIYSPSHFTWMDTNYPAGTPRQGYPVEIQAFWQCSLRFIATHSADQKWDILAKQVKDSIMHYYPLENEHGVSDCLHCEKFIPAVQAKKDNACRSNQNFLITLGVVTDSVLSQSILLATQSLIMPGAIRSLKDAPVTLPLAVYRDHQLLNDPLHPYWGHYCGDEDTRRKPAYHNGTAWSWPFFSYCEALYIHTKDQKNCTSVLMSAKQELSKGIINHLPEICDGDAPHYQRGCRAQAWSLSEYYRIKNNITQQSNNQHYEKNYN